MNVQLLIDSVVRQTTVLIAQLATAGGARAPLAHVANQVFLDLADELRRQGVGRKVSADMFGLSLRTYLRKLQRIGERESETEAGTSLYNAVLGYLGERGVVTRGDVLARFARDEPEMVIAVLRELGDSGLVFQTGSAERTVYRATTTEELGSLSRSDAAGGVDALVWALVYREGPLGREALGRLVRTDTLDASLDRLVQSGRVERSEGEEPVYSAQHFSVPQGDTAGWEAAVFDHFQAVVRTICGKLSLDGPSAEVGGSTYSFEVWAGHPLEGEVLAQLEATRTHAADLRARVRGYNDAHPRPSGTRHVTFYAGQSVLAHTDDDPHPDTQ